MIHLLSSSSFSFSKIPEKQNQDSILACTKYKQGYLFAIADGVGGYKGGEIASKIAIQNLEMAHNDVFSASLAEIKRLDPEYNQASTTLTFGYLTEEGLYVGHIGDCRLYIKQGNKLRQKTKDHTTHQKLLDEKIYTKKELKELSGKNIITTAISAQVEMKPDEFFIPISEIKDENNEVSIYIMSDGAHHFWEHRPRFSEKTTNSVIKFSAALQKRIEKSPIDDYSLVAVQFKISETE